MKHCKKKIDWKAIWKFCITIICGLYFDITSRIGCKKYDERHYDQCVLLKVYN